MSSDAPMRGARGLANSLAGRDSPGGMKGAMSKMSMKEGGKSGYGRVKAMDTKHGPGKAVGEDSLGSAVGELYRQHPHNYTDHGPFRSHTAQPDGDGMKK